MINLLRPALDNPLKIPQTKITMRSARLPGKSEYQISKSETNTNAQNNKLQNSFEHYKVGILRIVSNFVLRISSFSTFAFTLLFLILFTTPVLAQTNTNSFTSPRTDPDVPQNQHIFAQTVTIEVMSAVICQITGIDPIDPSLGCVGINPATRKLGIIKPQLDENGKVQLGGMLGTTTDLIAFTYQPVVTTGAYTQHLAENFGITKKAYAQTGYGFEGLRPILTLWETVRNIAYILLTLAFIFIGIGVMLRVKIDPRTVMTIQNQIPKVIVAIILITLSYAISALLIDLMWVTTYAGVNVLSQNAEENGLGGSGSESLYYKASQNIVNNPLSFTNQLFETNKNGPLGNGMFHITQQVSNNVGELLRDQVKELLGVDGGEKCFDSSFKALLPGGKPVVDFGACAAGLLAFLASLTLKLVILVVLMVTLFKIWFNLLKAYIYTILYVIVSPVMIVFGLLPSKPMGFENWLRRLFVNVAVFPLTAFLIVGARLLMDLYQTKLPDGSTLFVPPLVGNSNPALNFGALLAFGALLITPHLQTILQEKMGVKGIGSPGLIGAGLAGGAAVLGAPVGRAMKHLNRRDQRGGAVGALALGKELAVSKALDVPAKFGSNYAKKKLNERDFRKSGDYASGHITLAEYRRDPKAWHDKQAGSPSATSSTSSPRKTFRERRREAREAGGSEGTGGGSAGAPRRSLRSRVWSRMRRNERGALGYDPKEKNLPGAHSASSGPAPAAGAHSPTSETGGTATINAGTVIINAGNIRGLSPEVGQHLDSNPGHAQHIQTEFARESVGKSFEGKSIEELKALPKEDITRQSAEAALAVILKRTKEHPPTA